MNTRTPSQSFKVLRVLCCCSALALSLHAQSQSELSDLSINGGIEDGKARLTIEGLLGGKAFQQPLIFSAFLEDVVDINRDRISQKIQVSVDVLQGNPRELLFKVRGSPEIRKVTGDQLQDWSLRYDPEGNRVLVLRPLTSEKPPKNFKFQIEAGSDIDSQEKSIETLNLVPPNPALLNGSVRVTADGAVKVEPESATGLIEVPSSSPNTSSPDSYRLHGMEYSLKLKVTAADPEAGLVSFRNSKLEGQLSPDRTVFLLTGIARVVNPKGGNLNILSGDVALTDKPTDAAGRLELNPGTGTYVLHFDKAGEYPVRLGFAAKVSACTGNRAGWFELHFKVAPAPLQVMSLKGVPEQTQFEFPGAQPDWVRDHFETYLPADGAVNLAWKQARDESEGKLFYAGDLLGQVTVSPGLMQQHSILDIKVMQGELRKLSLLIRGPGEVTRVLGENVLSWTVQPIENSTERRLLVEFNQPQKNRTVLQIQMQTPLAAFPQEIEPAHLLAEGATRTTGYLRVVNEGAVRIEVSVANGLSQISPEQFPETDLTKTFFRPQGTQRFAYRFAGGEFSLKVTADQVLPEIAVSELLAFRLGENETSVDAELELEIREAPLRELLVRIPKGYAVARLTASGLNDYFVRDLDGEPESELRLVYSAPVSGRQVIQLRLERNEPLNLTQWTLPRIEVSKAKSVRGHIGVAADAGYRVVPETTRGLTEIATAFFPRKVPGLQAAYRISEPTWSATLALQRLPQTVQVDAMHLFSIGEGIAYGSSVMNYLISGAPVSSFNVELSSEYFNVEFSGKDIRHWRKTDRGYLVQLHTPVSGSYTLLATYERPFKPQGETLVFNGARPLDVQSDQGHTIIISAYQFQVTPTQVSPGLLALETGEVPTEYRLFFDAPVLAAYRYTSRPFNLQLALAPLAQGDSLNLVVDRAALSTRVSKEGQVLTDVRYFVKNRGNPHFRVTLPADMQLWSVTVDGARVVPVTDSQANLIPLPQRADPNAVLTVDLKLASRSKNPSRIAVQAPAVGAPVMLAEWKFHPDAGRKLTFRSGSLNPTTQSSERTGLAQWRGMFSGRNGLQGLALLASGIGFMILAACLWRWTLRSSAYRGGARFVIGTCMGVLAFLLGSVTLLNAALLASNQTSFSEPTLTFLAPIQQAGSAATVELANAPDHLTFWSFVGLLVPAFIAVVLWLYAVMAGKSFLGRLAWLAGWGLLVYQALRMENGSLPVTLVCLAFLAVHLLWPALKQLWQLPARSPEPASFAGGTPPAPAALGLVAFLLLGASHSGQLLAVELEEAPPLSPKKIAAETLPIAEAVTQQVRVQEKFAFGSAKIIWKAQAYQVLPLIFKPAVMTRIAFPTNSLKLLVSGDGQSHGPQLLAREAGQYEIQLDYQLQVSQRGDATGFDSPLQHGLVNRMTLSVEGLDVEVFSPQAISVERTSKPGETTAELLLSPANDAWIAWRPRSRDVAAETPVFYADLAHLYVPLAGVIEGAHHVAIRPAQGQLSTLVVIIPSGTTVMDVLDAAAFSGLEQTQRSPVHLVSVWRFDPDTRQLRLTFSEPQSRPFALIVRTQVASGPLPIEHTVGLLEVQDAAGQLGSLAVATPADIQLESANPTNLSPMNLEDFATPPVAFMQTQIPGLTVRRAFRYSEAKGSLSLQARAVEPDVRAETQQTVSLGEDRTVLVANTVVSITRAGIFKLSFNLPNGFDVETISGPSLSHWTESKFDTNRIITLHLNGKSEGQQQFSITLAGAGTKTATGWSVPPLRLREATKERGILLLVPEQGMRLQPATRENLTQLDPQKSGVAQKGVLAFRILQSPWRLLVDIEQVDAWVQVASLQHVSIAEAQAKVTANLNYQIENTGLKGFRVLIATNAENVRFTGEQVADFMPMPNTVTNGMQEWEIKLHRKVIGSYRLQCNYQLLLPENAADLKLRGVVANDVNLQRGFVTIESAGRVQLRLDATPQTLQPTEWQSIPQSLRVGLQATAAHYSFRLVEPLFELPLKLDRHQAAKLLAARVNSVLLSSVVSDDGGMLTQARIEVLPGDKRLLSLTLPKDGRFWFAFVNQAGVWPWRDGEAILIPLDQHDKSNTVAIVEVFYSSVSGVGGRRRLDMEMVAPKFDLPLENITWRIALDPRWKVTSWRGNMQLDQEQLVRETPSADPQQYLEYEMSNQRERIKQAENLLVFGNRSLEQGEQQQARRAFQAAFGLSTHDAAFNEDARVQLHNLKVQQALVGLNMLQAGSAPETEAAGGKLQELRARKEANYTQKDAEVILQRNTADENAALTKLAERIVQQQDAVLTAPTAIRASVPEQGLLLTFKRSVLVDPKGTLSLKIEASNRSAGLGLRLAAMLGILAILGALARAAKAPVLAK